MYAYLNILILNPKFGGTRNCLFFHNFQVFSELDYLNIQNYLPVMQLNITIYWQLLVIF